MEQAKSMLGLSIIKWCPCFANMLKHLRFSVVFKKDLRLWEIDSVVGLFLSLITWRSCFADNYTQASMIDLCKINETHYEIESWLDFFLFLNWLIHDIY